MAVVVHAASIQDRDGAKLVLGRLLGRFPRLQIIWAAAYAGKLIAWTWATGGWLLTDDSHHFDGAHTGLADADGKVALGLST